MVFNCPRALPAKGDIKGTYYVPFMSLFALPIAIDLNPLKVGATCLEIAFLWLKFVLGHCLKRDIKGTYYVPFMSLLSPGPCNNHKSVHCVPYGHFKCIPVVFYCPRAFPAKGDIKGTYHVPFMSLSALYN